ncbi:hypothetical protein GQ651_04520 [Alphaproteobacteria bacterium GH1-50]|uniref:Long-subunit fatty acid transport protein n=2 Tax=Kangsaoukella pontilimi TaxID=2691042 RepID=A0A7C9IPU0_9RHOB|nr:hypothetical protein [Kangsaoukella pontilimi]
MGASATAAHAGGIERSSLSTGILFEEGNYVEFSFGSVAPDVSGAQVGTFDTTPAGGTTVVPGLGQSSGDVAADYKLLSFGYKNDLTDKLHLALIVDQPIGANVDYAAATAIPPYVYNAGTGSQADVDSLGLTALLRYQLENNISVYGGLRAIRTKGEVSLFTSYTMNTTTETDLGYVLGAAWEKPEIAARVALTYQSEVTHDFTATEAFPAASIPSSPTQFSSTIPQSVTLEFQTGVAADTLVFGSVKWTDWSEFDISPTIFGATSGGGSLVDYDEDVITYNLGLGRRFNDEWSGAILIGHEKSQGGFSGNLGPTDGYTSLGLAVTRTIENVEVTVGGRYIWIGDAETENGTAPGTALGDFDDNNGVALGLRVGYSF